MSELPFEWRVSKELVPYPDAVEEMEKRVALIESGDAPELIWLLSRGQKGAY